MNGPRLDGKVALVTGASKGIGRGLAIGLAQHGAGVALAFKNDDAGTAEACADIERADGAAIAVQADISRRADIERMVEETVARFGRLDVLVNNAGRTRFGLPEETTDEDWDDVVGTNLRGSYFATVAAVRHMGPGGSVINISSCAARLMVNSHALYTMSKSGLEGLTRQMALEYAPRGIRVNGIAPAPTLVARNLEYDPRFDERWARVTPMGRVALPEDYVGTLAFLASDMSAFLTGAVLNVDGGWSIKGHTPDMSEYDYGVDRQRG